MSGATASTVLRKELGYTGAIVGTKQYAYWIVNRDLNDLMLSLQESQAMRCLRTSPLSWLLERPQCLWSRLQRASCKTASTIWSRPASSIFYLTSFLPSRQLSKNLLTRKYHPLQSEIICDVMKINKTKTRSQLHGRIHKKWYLWIRNNQQIAVI